MLGLTLLNPVTAAHTQPDDTIFGVAVTGGHAVTHRHHHREVVDSEIVDVVWRASSGELGAAMGGTDDEH